MSHDKARRVWEAPKMVELTDASSTSGGVAMGANESIHLTDGNYVMYSPHFASDYGTNTS